MKDSAACSHIVAWVEKDPPNWGIHETRPILVGENFLGNANTNTRHPIFEDNKSVHV